MLPLLVIYADLPSGFLDDLYFLFLYTSGL